MSILTIKKRFETVKMCLFGNAGPSARRLSRLIIYPPIGGILYPLGVALYMGPGPIFRILKPQKISIVLLMHLRGQFWA